MQIGAHKLPSIIAFKTLPALIKFFFKRYTDRALISCSNSIIFCLVFKGYIVLLQKDHDGDRRAINWLQKL
ncbi:hypothetical protein C2G38_2168383 [Gigaspora rosea]|uniref:Uncharacterized protein n=1 Tax=Gigaspora rosea TaxID=44941 RepID=A0A397VPU1_9GLOM|nr:hypothetical protein C2G38_2168383 [Gigaspora rosea]